MLALAAAFALTSCGYSLPTYRYRMTVEVETPEGLRSGSTVIEVKNGSGPTGGVGSSVRGEAVAVDLGARGILFALLRTMTDGDHASEIAPAALLTRAGHKRGNAEAFGNNIRAMKKIKQAAELPRTYYPALVRFLGREPACERRGDRPFEP